MLSIKDIDDLLALSRMEIPTTEKEELRQDIDAILSYVDSVQAAATTALPRVHPVRNVMRPDVPTNETGFHTTDLLKAAADSQDGYVKVKKIL